MQKVEKVSYRVTQGGKGGGGSAHTPVEAPDSLRSNAKARILLLLGEGPVKGGLSGQRIFLDGTPLVGPSGSQNFTGVKWEFRNGTQTQDPIKGFPAVESETRLGVDLKAGNGWTYAVSNKNIDAVNIRIGIPSLYSQADNGDINGSRLDYQIYVATDGGSFVLYGEYAAVGKTTTLYERTHRVNLPQANTGWQVRVVRLTADSTSAKLVNPTNIQAITTIIDARLRYPLSALLFVEFDAQAFNGNIPKISCLLDGREIRVPNNYNPETRTYSGVWDGTWKWACTDNPAWVFLDICTDKRYGLGDRIGLANMDKWELYRISQRCDQMVPDGLGGGGTEPRFTFNCYIQSRAEAWTVLKDIAAGFAGMTFWANNLINVLSDMPGPPAQVVTRANVVGGKFVYSSGSEKSHYSTFMVNYSDPDNHYKDVTTGGFDDDLMRRYGARNLEMTAIGCTRESEAQRRGFWALLTNDIDRQIQFTIGAEGIDFLPGDVVAVADDRFSGRKLGGRVSAATNTVVTTDILTDASVGDSIMINLGGNVEVVQIKEVDGKNLTLITPLSKVPANGAVFVIDAENLALQKYRITSVTHGENGDFTVKGFEYEDAKYDAVDNGARMDTGRPKSLIPTGVVNIPGNVEVSAYDVLYQGQRIATLQATWSAPVNSDGTDQRDIVAYEAQWKRGNNDWINTPQTGLRELIVSGIFEGDYLVRVRAINSAGASSVWSTSALTNLKGRQGDVPAPVGFRSTPMLWGIKLDWGFPADTDDTSHTQIQYATNSTPDEGTADIMELTNSTFPTATYQQTGLKAGQIFFYRARLVDRNGNVSPWTVWTRGQSSSNTGDYLEALGDDFFTKADGKALLDQISFNADDIIQGALNDYNIVDLVRAENGSAKAEILQLKQWRATDVDAFAQYQIQASAQFAQQQAAINQKLTAYTTADRAEAIYTVKAGVMWNGEYYDAGLSVSTIADGDGIKARVAIKADQFLIATGQGDKVQTVFVVDGNTVYMDTALIKDGTIENSKIGNYIRSNNYQIGVAGWNIDKSGVAEFNNVTVRGSIYAKEGNFSLTSTGNTVTLDNYGLTVYLPNNGMVRVGTW